ncbi:MAG: BrnT family toxin [Pseudomonadota bacterium]
MRFVFDPAKSEANRRKHGFGLDSFNGFDREPVTIEDKRRNYREERYRSFGRIDGLGYMIAFTISQQTVRLISFRRAHEKEMKRYEKS